MEPAIFGFAFDPFEHLDSTKDAHLQEYLIVPPAVQSALSDQPLAVFAQPGGGKSALRMYAANFYRESRGVRFPVTYIPQDYSTDPRFHFDGIRHSLARAAFIYLASYPDLFFALSPNDRQALKTLFSDLPFGLDFHLQTLRASRFLSDLEAALDTPAFSSLPRLGNAHHQLADELEKESPAAPLALDDCFALLQQAFGVKSFHVLVDGLDGFIETRPSETLLAWIEPLLNAVEAWEKKDIYLKCFLPMEASDAPALTNFRALRAAALTWDDNLLAQVVRRRVFVATRGAFDTLDALSAPGLRNLELTLARQLGEKEKLPRQIILKCQKLLQNVAASNRSEIQPEDLFSIGEPPYAIV
jgi:hypothetical protein